MDEETLEKLTRFISQANIGHLHPLDWDRFYEFVLAAFGEWESSDRNIVRRLLEEGGFSKGEASGLADFCEQVRDLLGYIKKTGRLI